MKTTDDQSELFVVVDKDDKILGYRTRWDCHHDKSLIHRGVHLYIFDERNRVLLQRRSLTKDTDPGYWSMSAGGHVGKGESYQETMARELKEEIGSRLPFKFVEKFIFEYQRETEMDALFIAKGNGPFRLDPQEVAGIKFFSKSDLQKRLKIPSFKLTRICREGLTRLSFL